MGPAFENFIVLGGICLGKSKQLLLMWPTLFSERLQRVLRADEG